VSRKYSARLAEIVAQQHARRRLPERQGYVAMIEMLASDSARRLMLSMLADELEVRVTAFTQLARIVPLTTPEVLDARSLEEKIVGAGRTGAFLALTVDPCRDELEPARQVFAILIEGIWFAQDSPLEEGGFELVVPL
jgi:hypothetical protein